MRTGQSGRWHRFNGIFALLFILGLVLAQKGYQNFDWGGGNGPGITERKGLGQTTRNKMTEKDRLGSKILTYSDNDSTFVMRIHDILVGDVVANNGLIRGWHVEKARKMNKEIVYFEVSIENFKGPDVVWINWLQFGVTPESRTGS